MFHSTVPIPKLNATCYAFYTVVCAQQPDLSDLCICSSPDMSGFNAEARSSFVTVWVCCTWFRAITKPQSQNPYTALW